MAEELQGIPSHALNQKLYVVSVNYSGSPDDGLGILPRPDLVDEALNPVSDWVRLNGFTWLVWTGLSSELISRRIQNLVGERARILTMRASQQGLYGWQPDWVWKWLAERRTLSPGLGPPEF